MPGDLVAESVGIAFVEQDAAGEALGQPCVAVRSHQLGEHTSLGAAREDRDRTEHAAGAGRKPLGTCLHGVAHARRRAIAAFSAQQLGDEEGVAGRDAVDAPAVLSEAAAQGDHRFLAQQRHFDAGDVVGRDVGERAPHAALTTERVAARRQ